VRFEIPWLLWAAPLVTLLIAGLGWWSQRRRLRLAAAWSPAARRLAGRRAGSSVPLLGLAALAGAVALAGPRGARGVRETGGLALNVLIAVDVSRSMLAEDQNPNRLQRAIREASRLVQDLPADRIGVIAFAGQSYLLAPLTLDHSAVMLYLQTLDPDLASAGGTDLAAVFRQAAAVLQDTPEGGDRAVVLFTDGEGHDSLQAAAAAARALGEDGVRLIMVAQGSELPVRIPVRDPTGTLTEYQRDAEGEEVMTARRDAQLRAIVEASGGLLIPAERADQAGAVREELGALSRRPLRERRLADLTPLAWVAALVSALALLLHTATRRGAGLAGLGLLALTQTGQAQRPGPGDRFARQGRAAQAAAAFRQEAQATGRDTSWFNAGTSALAAGDLDAARDALGRAAASLDPGLRYKALYNLGVAALQQARQNATVREEREAEATARLRQALLLAPDAREAKWNLELLVRRRPPSPPQQSAAAQRPSGGAQDQPAPASGLSRSEADAILSAVSQDEASTRASVLRRQRLRTTANTKDW